MGIRGSGGDPAQGTRKFTKGRQRERNDPRVKSWRGTKDGSVLGGGGGGWLGGGWPTFSGRGEKGTVPPVGKGEKLKREKRPRREA